MTELLNKIRLWWHGESLCYIRKCTVCRRETELSLANFNPSVDAEFTTRRRHNGILEQVAIQSIICSRKCQNVAAHRAERVAAFDRLDL